MADITFTPFTTVIPSTWAQTVNNVAYRALGFTDAGPFTPAQAVSNLGFGSTSSPLAGAGYVGYTFGLGYSIGTLGSWLNSHSYQTVSSIAALRLLPITGVPLVTVTGYYTPGDGGGGIYYYDSSDTTSTDNGGTIIVAADGGRWKLAYTAYVTVKQFGAKADAGTTDNSAALAAAAAWISSSPQKNKLVFTTGSYGYSVSPNWAIQNADIEAQGEVHLKFSGTGNAVVFDAGSGNQYIYNVRFRGNFVVDGNAAGGHGIYVRSVHHSIIEGRIAGAGSTSAGLRVDFSVMNQYNVRPTSTEGAFVSLPQYAIYLTRRGVNENSSNNVFNTSMSEGLSGASPAIFLDWAVQNTFIGGTSEITGGFGLQLTANSSRNTFINMDLESNTGGALSDAGASNKFINIIAQQTITFTGVNAAIYGGDVDAVVDNGTGTILDSVRYANSGGNITGTGRTTKRNVFNATNSTYDLDLVRGSLSSFTSVPNNAATTVLTLPSTGNSVFQVFAYLPGAGAAATYGAYALIYQDLGTSRILSQVNGASLSITMSGQNVQVTQTSGVAQNVVAAGKVV